MLHHAVERIARPAILLGLAVSAVLALSTGAQAAAARFVASNGDDGNDCTRPAPCRTLQRGVQATPVNGELHILDSGLYADSVTIAKSLSISAIGVSATTGSVTINGAGIVVALRGLLLNGKNSNVTGILIQNAGTVYIESCVIEGFISHGIELETISRLHVSNTISRGNGSSGLRVHASGPIRVTVADSYFQNNGSHGMSVTGTRATVTRSVFSGNAGDGINADATRINVSHSTAANNASDGFSILGSGELGLEYSEAHENGASGVIVGPTAEALISNNFITHNAVGVNNAGTTRTRGNNTIESNADDENGTPSESFTGR